MLRKSIEQKRKGSVLVEYGLLIAGIVLVSVVGIAVLGHKVADQFSLMAVIMPGAHADDNHPIAAANTLPFTADADGALVLDSTKLVDSAGKDRLQFVIGAGAGEKLIIDK